jgi:hypothetical protein
MSMVTSFDDRTYWTGDSNPKHFGKGSEIVGILRWLAFEGRTAEINEPTHLPVLDIFLS